ncbi:hypothetical protein M433DRAFT_77111 [Acidomyces richmondensis BFW]|nr:MAG: hypothetical protein FE78DRAFT_91148 [Acidomyces sp. 'richmondensis']KYG40857.1 hypothetical protein M433DRAFT_77111 [Acidomyces richmondensis BFW]
MTTFFPLQRFSCNVPWAHLAAQPKVDDLAAFAIVSLASFAYLTKGTLWSKPDPYRFKLYERPQKQLGDGSDKQLSRSLGERLSEENANIAVMWASQSGTAERLSGRMAKDISKQFGARVLLADISDIDPSSFETVFRDKLVIFIASTFGEGDPSDNMHDFWTWMHQSDNKDLNHLRFVALGLGNSKYKHYNHVINVLCQRLQARGAQALLPTARADDAAGETEEHFLEWKEQVFGLLQTKLGYRRQEAIYEPSLQLIEDPSLEPIDLHNGIPKSINHCKTPSNHSKVYQLRVIQSRELFGSTDDRNCIHMELDLSEYADLKYKTGDHLGVWPINPQCEVDRLLKVLGLESKRAIPLHIKSLDGIPVKVPSPTTVEALFRNYIEICAPVSREHVTTLVSFAPTAAAREFLDELGQDKTVYARHVSANYTNFGRLLEVACPEPGAWSQLPLSIIIEMLPAMQPRYYSISSSSVVQARQAAITAVVADTLLPKTGDRVFGISTNYLLSARDGTHPRGLSYGHSPDDPFFRTGYLYAHLRKSTFKLPATTSTPIIMVGAGTGVAPFRAFVQERSRLKSIGREVGITKLYYGCRNSRQDFVYQSEFTEAAKLLGASFSLVTAFSRPEEDGEKKYVQDRILEESDAICDLLVGQNAYFYICGSAAMARDVSDTISRIIMSGQCWNENQMKEFAEQQKRHRRWLQDVWG